MLESRVVNAAHPLLEPPDPNAIDHFVYLRDVSWRAYEALLEMRRTQEMNRQPVAAARQSTRLCISRDLEHVGAGAWSWWRASKSRTGAVH